MSLNCKGISIQYISGPLITTWRSTVTSLNMYGRDKEVQNTISYHSNTGSIIPEKEIVRDLGVLMSKDGTFKTHIKNVVDAAKKMCGWILRTFRTREVSPITRKSLVLSKLITAVNSGLHQRRGIFKLLKPSRDPSPEKYQASRLLGTT